MSTTENFSEQDSLRLITEMIQKAKASHFHENGTSAILWGSIVGFCGLMKFAQDYFKFSIGFDVWLLTLFALLPQIIVSVRNKKRQVVSTDMETALDAVWLVYGITLFAVIIYLNTIPYTSTKIFAQEGIELVKKNKDGVLSPFVIFAPSGASLLMIVYAFPTLVTGLARGFKPMIIGAIACYSFFFISLFTNSTYDNLLSGFAGIGNWLIPGLILRNRFNKRKLI